MTPPSLRSRLSAAQVPAAALLPLRLFLGVTFLYAGVDKILDPRFLDASSPASIQAQLHAYERFSPLAPLIQLGQPYALAIGVLIALAEIAVGLGTLTGVLYRASAVGGALLAGLFWLTASWATRPYYVGPDLPYALGWITLAAAGHGGLLVLRWPAARTAYSPTRRTLLQLGALGLATFAVAILATPVRLFGGTAVAGSPSPSPTPGGSTSPAGPSASGPSPTPAPSPGSSPVPGIAVASVADVEKTGGFAFKVPFSAPAPLPAGDPGVIVQLEDGTFVAYDAVCTHEACTVEWDRADGILACPCHGAEFDPADGGRVLAGPAEEPLAALPIVVDEASGTILLRT